MDAIGPVGEIPNWGLESTMVNRVRESQRVMAKDEIKREMWKLVQIFISPRQG